ncbi:MAG: AraC family transcriptional regulator [Roseiarcus sp.]
MVSFFDDLAVFHADTCKPLRIAADAGEVEMRALARGAYPGDRLPAHEMRELKTVGYWDAPRDQTFALDWHRNEGIEFAFLSRGRVGFGVDDKRYELTPGHLTITRPWQSHRLGFPVLPACRMHWVILDVGVRRPNQEWRWPKWLVLSRPEIVALTTLLQSNEQPVWPANAGLRNAFEALADLTRRRDDPALMSRLKIQINATLLEVLTLLSSQPVPLDTYLASSRRTVALFLDSLAGSVEEPWALEAMAEACGLGRTQFSNYCVEITNISPMDYLNGLRIKRARELLGAEPDRSITDIAASCGFDTSQYFATRFRREVGKSPREYRAARQADSGDVGAWHSPAAPSHDQELALPLAARWAKGMIKVNDARRRLPPKTIQAAET